MMARRRRRLSPLTLRYEEPYRDFWRSLSPRERLRRAWKLRKRVRDIQKLHDEKLVPRPSN
jgi:hypothetical protein